MLFVILVNLKKSKNCKLKNKRNMLRAILIDLSGTLHIENQVIPGAVEALNKLRSSNVMIKFVTNTTKECKRILHERLTNLGFTLKPDEMHTSLEAARVLLVSRNLKPLLLVSPEALEDFEGIACGKDDEHNAVVIGLAPSEFHYNRLNEAFRCLLNGAQLIAIHAGKYYKRSDGLAIGPGCFVKGLEYSAQCKAELVGKPNRAFFLSALGDIPPEQAVIIGDDVTDDIKGAMDAGLKGILVQTGKYCKGDENKINPMPTMVVANFSEAVEKILSGDVN